jgi:acetate kinase
MAASFNKPETACILTINGGSSSIKFALYAAEPSLDCRLKGEIERIGPAGGHMVVTDTPGDCRHEHDLDIRDHVSAAHYLIDWLEERVGFGTVYAVGHRVVHGMQYDVPQRITPALLDELHRISPYDPDHLPVEIELMETFRRRQPKLLQVACFDTSFHRTMPRVARLLPIPRRYDAVGIQRYGFHGLSFAYLMETLNRTAGEEAARGRIILAHLGSGASMTAVHKGQSMDTTMGFTPAAGMPMGTRPGDMDPGVLWFWMHSEHLTAVQINRIINHQSGLLGVSETSSDLRDLLARQTEDIRAAEAVEMFCYNARKWIGSLSAVLGGLDTLVFSGGIGENAGPVRTRICSGLAFLGVTLDEDLNGVNAPVISSRSRPVTVRVIRTNEEIMIAKAALAIIQKKNQK